jgi:replicative DNA helicase
MMTSDGIAQNGMRIPPHNLEIEQSLLGAMLLRQDAIGTAVETVSASDFYKPAHGHIFEAICSLWAAGEAIDAATVADELRRAGLLDLIGGPNIVVDLISAAPVLANAASYARRVEESSLLRKLIATAGEIAEMGYAPVEDVNKTIDAAEALVYNVGQHRFSESTKELRELMDDTLDHLERLYERGEAITGTPSGFRELDEILAGFQKSALIIVGARPAMGKTAFALGAAANAAVRSSRPVLFFSLEMSHLELTQRLLSTGASVNASKFRTGKFDERDWGKIVKHMGILNEAPLWIDDNPNLTVMEIRAKARRLKSRIGDLGLIVVDYVQLMTGRSSAESRQVEISEISRGLKILARELDTPVIALSQLSRGLEQRTDKRPMLSDLRESGSLEQDADVVLFLYRDEIYNTDSVDKGTAEVIVAKHRSGPTGTARMVFTPEYTRFADMARGHGEM